MWATSFCGYDGAGNLFADGLLAKNFHRDFGLVELSKGSKTLKVISLNVKIKKPGQVQWDGSYITVVDAKASNVYRLQVSGSKATIEGVTALSDTGTGVQASWIDGGTIIVPFRPPARSGSNNVGFWNYPAGGSPTQTDQGPAGQTNAAVTISPGS